MILNPEIVRSQIVSLITSYPELADDDVLRADMIEGETDLEPLLRMLEEKRQEADALATAVAMSVEALRQRQHRFERRDQAMRNLMLGLLQVAGLKRVELPEATLSVRQGTAKVVVYDETLLPDNLCRIKREPDKPKIKAAIEGGAVVEGASLNNPEPTLAVRVR